MRIPLNFYPTYDQEIANNVCFNVTYRFYYFDGEGRHDIDCDITPGRIGFDSKTKWNFADYDLHIICDIKIKNPDGLYGIKGLAPKNSKLSICLEWYSQKDKIRQVTTLEDYILDVTEPQSLRIETTIKKNFVSNNVNLNILLFLKESAAELLPQESKLNNDVGVMLGTLDKKELFITGQGSLFPIYIQSNPNDNKLWRVIIKYDDPEIDKLSDSVKVIINSAHKDYALTDDSNPQYCDRLVNEIVASALSILFNQLKCEDKLNNLTNNYPEGSILNYTAYCKNVLNFDFSDPNSISDSIREYMEGDND